MSSPPCWMTMNKIIILSFIVLVIQHGRQGIVIRISRERSQTTNRRDFFIRITVSTITGLGWYGWPFSIQHFSARFRLKRVNSSELSLCKLQSRNIVTQMHFQPFQPGLRPDEKVDQPKHGFSPNGKRKNPTNQKRLISREHDFSSFPVWITSSNAFLCLYHRIHLAISGDLFSRCQWWWLGS